MNDKQFVFLQKVLPKRLVTELMGRFAERHVPILTPAFMKWFAKRFDVDMSEAEKEQLSDYRTFNEFFTRPLKDGLRPLQVTSTEIACPVDGAISQIAPIESDQVIQAKGKYYSLSALLANQERMVSNYTDGAFTTIYLSPKDYHRIHMPIQGKLTSMTYVPGDLYSVNQATVRELDNLFARNERVICEFDTDKGKMAMILVGATIVGSIETVWSGTITPPRSGQVHHWDYTDQDISLAQGAEMGRFKLGSTVILLFEKDTIRWLDSLQADDAVRLGQKIAD